MEMICQPIGVIRSPFDSLEGMPIQPTGAKGVRGEVHIFEQYREGLKDLEGFSHIILLYHFHKSTGFKLLVKPFMDTVPRGLFSTRAPNRPSKIGLSIVRLLATEGTVLAIEDVDILDQTPLLDIKPYVAKFDAAPADRFGWLEKSDHKAEHMRSDSRFTSQKEDQG